MKRLLLAYIAVMVIGIPGISQSKSVIENRAIRNVVKEMTDFQRSERKRDSINRQPLGSFAEEDFLRRYNFAKSVFQKLQSVNKNDLSVDDKINLELLLHQVRNQIDEYDYKSYLNPILSDEGFHTALARRSNTVFQSRRDAEQYIELLKDIPRFVQAHFDLMRKGLAAGISQPKSILNGYDNTYRQHIVDTIERSVFWKPFLKRPFQISETDWQLLRTNAQAVIRERVVRSYQKINEFFEKEYLPQSRATLGASHFPNGAEYYEKRVKHFTSTDLSAEDVYQIGLREVARIKSEMEGVLNQVKFKGTFSEFVQYLRTDPKFYPKSADELLKEASFIAKKADGKLPSLFGKLPRQPYTVSPVPEYLAPTYTAGRYSGAVLNSKSPGEYWVNTYNLPSRTLYTLEALTLHEAVPGHHLQVALTKELDLPEFRRNLYINAFGEGWGLYSEYLGHEMGFYKDPYSLFGRLTYEMWRACRLVIDVGIHMKGWTRDQAVNYLAEHTALSIHEVNTEVNRYISWPGQALAYKIGEIRIKECRKKCEQALGPDFDVRAFHDMVLSNGSVTLSILDEMTDRFITDWQNRKKKPL